MTIKDSIRELSKNNNANAVKLYTCEVDSVNEDARTCDVFTVTGNAELTITDVFLLAQSNDGFIQIPVVGSSVIVAYSLEVGYFVCAFSDVSKIISNQDEFIFNGGDNGGLIKIDPLVTYNNTTIAAIKTAVAAGFAAVDTALNSLAPGSGASSAAFNASAGSIQTLQKNSIENPKIQH